MRKQLLEDDVQARKDALDVTRSFIIQAPAGSGKTELLIQRYLGLLSVVENPEEVIAITFTRKAAAEMQLRVLAALRRRQSGDEPEEEHERKTYALAGEALRKSDTRQWNLMGNPRRLRILTLDALNASIARAQPFSSAGTRSRVVVGAELQAVYRSAAVATLDWLAEKGALHAATVEVLQHVDHNTWLYTTYVSQMLGTRDQWLPFVGSGSLTDAEAQDLRNKFEESLEFAVLEHLQQTAVRLSASLHADGYALFDYAACNMKEAGASASPICSLEGLSASPAPIAEAMHQWRGLAELLLTQKGEFRKKVDKRQGFPPGDKPEKDGMHALLASLADDTELADGLQAVRVLPPVRYADEQWNVLLALIRLLPVAAGELQRLFNEQGITDHINVALAAAAALGSAENPGDIALLLDYQVQHLLVDEMQDTSAAQYRMLETLTGGWVPGDGRSLCCVGDPMQSIYRFRNAEVGQFLFAQEFGIGHVHLEPLTLRRNFRSGECLVDWFNTVFPTILAADDDPIRGAVAYSEAVAVDHLRGQGACVTHAVFGSDVDGEAATGCRVIVETLDNNPDDDMAVLVRGRTQLPQLLGKLRSTGIRYRAVEIDRLTDLPEIIELLALTRAAAHQGDRIAWLALLRAPWIGMQWSDLHALVRNDTSSTVWELLQRDERLRCLSEHGQQAVTAARPALALLTAARRSQSLRDLVERAWFNLGGPGALDDDYAVENVYRYLDVLGDLERGGTLMDVGELESVLDLERVSSDDDARLHIMTMHRAKGLQFDHVLLFGLGRQPGKGDRRVLSWFDIPEKHGVNRKIISPVGSRVEVSRDPVHRYIELSEVRKDHHEQARLLYVACTRARKSLHLMGNTAITADGTSFKAARSDSLLHLLWPAVEPEFARQFANARTPVADSDDPVWATPVLRRFSAPWTLPDPRPLPRDAAALETGKASDKVEFYWVGSDARIAGTLTHRCLQRISAEQGPVTRVDGAKLQQITSRWLRETGLSDAAARPILKRVVSAIMAMLDDETGRWILRGDGYTELPLTGIVDGELVSVILDRVRIDTRGTHWIIDYKTSSHEGGSLDDFLQVEAERYKRQLARYVSLYQDWSEAKVKCALYFPLLQSFLEVPV